MAPPHPTGWAGGIKSGPRHRALAGEQLAQAGRPRPASLGAGWLERATPFLGALGFSL